MPFDSPCSALSSPPLLDSFPFCPLAHEGRAAFHYFYQIYVLMEEKRAGYKGIFFLFVCFVASESMNPKADEGFLPMSFPQKVRRRAESSGMQREMNSS